MATESPEIEWDLRIFAGVDLVGSTAFKTREEPHKWQFQFREFYEGFPAELAIAYDGLSLNDGEVLAPAKEPLSLWKFNGDEILLSASLGSHRDVLNHILALKHTAKKQNKLFRDKRVDLRVKVGSWLAGFPVMNRIIRDESGKIIDYIGTSIDIGFRLSKFASTRNMPLSVDLALLVAEALSDAEVEGECSAIQLQHLGKHKLKGVLNEIDYPVICVNTADGEWKLIDKIEGQPEPQTWPVSDWKRYLDSFFKDSSFLHRPFIADGRFGEVPKDFESNAKEIVRQTEQEVSARSYDDTPTNEEADDPDTALPDDIKTQDEV